MRNGNLAGLEVTMAKSAEVINILKVDMDGPQ